MQATNNSKDKIDERKPTPKQVVSHVFRDGTMIDMIFSKQMNKTAFVLARKDQNPEIVDDVLVSHDGNIVNDPKVARLVMFPMSENNDLVSKNFVHFAPNFMEFGSLKDLHRDIKSLIKKYVFIEDRFYDISATYILLTWVFDKFNTLPYLRVVGHYGTGKSRFLEVVGSMCNRAMMASGSISMAAIYRTLDLVKGTLVFDEADFKSSDMADEIIKILNGGHRKNSPVVRMNVGPTKIKTETFEVYGPKILSSRQNFTDIALESRCITQRLYPQKKLNVPVHLPDEFETETDEIKSKLLLFRLKYYHLLKEDESSLKDLEFPRLKQSALALTSIAKLIDESVLDTVLNFLTDYEQELLRNDTMDILADVLLSIARLIEFDPLVQEKGKLYVGQVTKDFNDRFYDDYADRETKKIDTRDGVLVSPGQVVSPRRIGAYISKLGIVKLRDAQGFYILVSRETAKIHLLVDRYGLKPVLEEERIKRKAGVPRTTFEAESDPLF